MDEDEYRRKRIVYGPICDCYDDQEVSSGWEAYMDDALIFPFKAKIINNIDCEIPIGEIVCVTDSDSFDVEGTVDWLKDSADLIEEVEVQWNDEKLWIAVENLEVIDKNIETIEAIKDWNFWLEKY